jgi:hypothetical protein
LELQSVFFKEIHLKNISEPKKYKTVSDMSSMKELNTNISLQGNRRMYD